LWDVRSTEEGFLWGGKTGLIGPHIESSSNSYKNRVQPALVQSVQTLAWKGRRASRTQVRTEEEI
jgi:hypothetical protein